MGAAFLCTENLFITIPNGFAEIEASRIALAEALLAPANG
jgi:hypothetical protein